MGQSVPSLPSQSWLPHWHKDWWWTSDICRERGNCKLKRKILFLNNHTKFENRILNIEQLDLSPGNLNSYEEKCPQIFAQVKKTLVERKIFLSWFEKNWFDKKKTQICRVSEEISTIWKFWIQYFISIWMNWRSQSLNSVEMRIMWAMNKASLIRNWKTVSFGFGSCHDVTCNR